MKVLTTFCLSCLVINLSITKEVILINEVSTMLAPVHTFSFTSQKLQVSEWMLLIHRQLIQ